jgi:hypothetical protein
MLLILLVLLLLQDLHQHFQATLAEGETPSTAWKGLREAAQKFIMKSLGCRDHQG